MAPSDEMANIAEIPLFPLGAVLFPNQLLPLHVFEERYKLMIAECLRDDLPFGVVLIKEGREVGYGAVPFTVGTTARIAEVQRLDQGRMELRCIGQRPFRIVEIIQERPYLRSRVEYLDHGTGAEQDKEMETLVASVKERFEQHLDILARLSDRDRVKLDLNLDPQTLSYLVGSILAVQMAEKQTLLEEPLARERLQREAALLARENSTLQTFIYLRAQNKQDPPGPGDLQRRISSN